MDFTKGEFAYFFKQHRLTAGMTQSRMADRLGVTANMIYRWENKKAFPRDVQALIINVRNVTKIEIRKIRGW